MRQIGTVVRVAQGLAIVRCPDTIYPSIGTDVLDADLTTVGVVVDVFGPTDRPYLGVSPVEGVSVATLLGGPVYAR